jgi:hypothetical protein
MKATLTHSEERQLAAQRELIENFQHIKDLKAGDVLRYTKNGNYRFPKQGELVVVYSVLPEIEKEDRSKLHENDFTLLIKDPNDGEIMQFAFDSRFFDRVDVK